MLIICHEDEVDDDVKRRIGDVSIVVIKNDDTLEIIADSAGEDVGETNRDYIVHDFIMNRLP